MAARSYHHKTAQECLTTAVPLVTPKATVQEVTDLLTKHARNYKSISYVYLVDAKRMLLGVVSIKDILVHSPHTIVAAIATDQVVQVLATDAADVVALTAIDHGIKSVPVVDAVTKQFVGVVTADTIQDILHRGHLLDTMRQAGAGGGADPRSTILTGAPIVHIRNRLPWLLLGLAGGLFAAQIVRSFETALEAHVLIVAFIPLVVYLADAVGSQTEIIFVRALALDPRLKDFGRFKAYFAREFVVSSSLAIILALLMGAITSWWFDAAHLVPLLAVAITSTLMLAMLVALVIPFLATKLKYDPALTSGPVATVIRDVMTLVVYFWVVALFL
jgi:magnesium transporter